MCSNSALAGRKHRRKGFREPAKELRSLSRGLAIFTWCHARLFSSPATVQGCSKGQESARQGYLPATQQLFLSIEQTAASCKQLPQKADAVSSALHSQPDGASTGCWSPSKNTHPVLDTRKKVTKLNAAARTMRVSGLE